MILNIYYKTQIVIASSQNNNTLYVHMSYISHTQSLLTVCSEGRNMWLC